MHHIGTALYVAAAGVCSYILAIAAGNGWLPWQA
jgi:hypothetical protein